MQLICPICEMCYSDTVKKAGGVCGDQSGMQPKPCKGRLMHHSEFAMVRLPCDFDLARAVRLDIGRAIEAYARRPDTKPDRALMMAFVAALLGVIQAGQAADFVCGGEVFTPKVLEGFVQLAWGMVDTQVQGSEQVH